MAKKPYKETEDGKNMTVAIARVPFEKRTVT
jgi:hypothetical protein